MCSSDLLYFTLPHSENNTSPVAPVFLCQTRPQFTLAGLDYTLTHTHTNTHIPPSRHTHTITKWILGYSVLNPYIASSLLSYFLFWRFVKPARVNTRTTWSGHTSYKAIQTHPHVDYISNTCIPPCSGLRGAL